MRSNDTRWDGCDDLRRGSAKTLSVTLGALALVVCSSYLLSQPNGSPVTSALPDSLANLPGMSEYVEAVATYDATAEALWCAWDNLGLPLHVHGVAPGQMVNVLRCSDFPAMEPIEWGVTGLAVDGGRWSRTSVMRHMERPKCPWLRLLHQGGAQVKDGSYSGRWSDMGTTGFVRTTSIPHDWTDFEALTFWSYSAVANDASVKILLYSDDPATEKTDCYDTTFQVDWEGWNSLSFPLAEFHAAHQPVGWGKIDALTFAGEGWGLSAKPDTCLWVDQVALARRPPEAMEK